MYVRICSPKMETSSGMESEDDDLKLIIDDSLDSEDRISDVNSATMDPLDYQLQVEISSKDSMENIGNSSPAIITDGRLTEEDSLAELIEEMSNYKNTITSTAESNACDDFLVAADDRQNECKTTTLLKSPTKRVVDETTDLKSRDELMNSLRIVKCVDTESSPLTQDHQYVTTGCEIVSENDTGVLATKLETIGINDQVVVNLPANDELFTEQNYQLMQRFAGVQPNQYGTADCTSNSLINSVEFDGNRSIPVEQNLENSGDRCRSSSNSVLSVSSASDENNNSVLAQSFDDGNFSKPALVLRRARSVESTMNADDLLLQCLKQSEIVESNKLNGDDAASYDDSLIMESWDLADPDGAEDALFGEPDVSGNLQSYFNWEALMMDAEEETTSSVDSANTVAEIDVNENVKFPASSSNEMFYICIRFMRMNDVDLYLIQRARIYCVCFQQISASLRGTVRVDDLYDLYKSLPNADLPLSYSIFPEEATFLQQRGLAVTNSELLIEAQRVFELLMRLFDVAVNKDITELWTEIKYMSYLQLKSNSQDVLLTKKPDFHTKIKAAANNEQEKRAAKIKIYVNTRVYSLISITRDEEKYVALIELIRILLPGKRVRFTTVDIVVKILSRLQMLNFKMNSQEMGMVRLNGIVHRFNQNSSINLIKIGHLVTVERVFNALFSLKRRSFEMLIDDDQKEVIITKIEEMISADAPIPEFYKICFNDQENCTENTERPNNTGMSDCNGEEANLKAIGNKKKRGRPRKNLNLSTTDRNQRRREVYQERSCIMSSHVQELKNPYVVLHRTDLSSLRTITMKHHSRSSLVRRQVHHQRVCSVTENISDVEKRPENEIETSEIQQVTGTTTVSSQNGQVEHPKPRRLALKRRYRSHKPWSHQVKKQRTLETIVSHKNENSHDGDMSLVQNETESEAVKVPIRRHRKYRKSLKVTTPKSTESKNLNWNLRSSCSKLRNHKCISCNEHERRMLSTSPKEVRKQAVKPMRTGRSEKVARESKYSINSKNNLMTAPKNCTTYNLISGNNPVKEDILIPRLATDTTIEVEANQMDYDDQRTDVNSHETYVDIMGDVLTDQTNKSSRTHRPWRNREYYESCADFDDADSTSESSEIYVANGEPNPIAHRCHVSHSNSHRDRHCNCDCSPGNHPSHTHYQANNIYQCHLSESVRCLSCEKCSYFDGSFRRRPHQCLHNSCRHTTECARSYNMCAQLC
ncbi:uncharacterized protein LOC141898282 [Tubulanus polymorphus]|uniref:uncharacterized protein LOC141898282 n=1 Tax=Tubulanus polymorphus TaxID=672921 RepID=UPI003DA37823